MHKILFVFALLLGLTLGVQAAPAQNSAPAQNATSPAKDTPDALIAVLKSDAAQAEKADACRRLARLGAKEAIPVLASLLADEKLSDMARYALEPIADPGVEDALRSALGTAKGRALVGAIGSLGMRRDQQAVGPLTRFLADADADVAQAAARALGRIGTAEAAGALQNALAGTPAGNHLALAEGLLRAAEKLAAAGQRDAATAIYDRLAALKSPAHQVRTAALRGAILARGKAGLPLLRQSLDSQDYVLFTAAVRTLAEIPGDEAVDLVAGAVGQLPSPRQIVVIQALAKRPTAAAQAAIVSLVAAGDKAVRLAAIRAVAALPTDGAALVRLLEDPDREIQQVAQESFASLTSPQVDNVVRTLLASSKLDQQLLAMELIGRRRMISAIAQLIQSAEAPDPKLRAAARKRLGELGAVAEVPILVKLLLAAKEPQDLATAEQALSLMGAKPDVSTAASGAMVAAMGSASLAQKGALVRVLGRTGGDDALKAVCVAVRDADGEVRATAIRTLGGWKTPEAVPELLSLAKGTGNPTEKMLGLRGYLDWAARTQLPVDQRLAMCRQAADMIQKTEEKRLLLAALGSIASADAMSLVVPYLDVPETKNEAAAAVVMVADKALERKKPPIDAKEAAKLIEPLTKATQVAGNTPIGQQAAAALKQAQAKAGKKK